MNEESEAVNIHSQTIDHAFQPRTGQVAVTTGVIEWIDLFSSHATRGAKATYLQVSNYARSCQIDQVVNLVCISASMSQKQN